MNIKKSIQTIFKAHTRNRTVQKNLRELEKLVLSFDHKTANIDQLQQLFEDIYKIDPRKSYTAAEIIARGNNFDCKNFAVEVCPSLGEKCGDDLMETAREHLKSSGQVDRARWAHNHLTRAKTFYALTNSLSELRRKEIDEGLDKVRWVFA